jgi:hypothetical protein
MYLEALWLFHIYFLFYFTIQQGCLHIHMMHLPFHYASNESIVLIEVYLTTRENVSS